ncbi:hypothetical protein ASU31_25110 [Pedobacter ginsenosidimutans]|uniref:FecR protein domain-containing protein n=1 Tax=Pedobacter ginsenosidimutans TaxID=687842 RepID=A0A0T5VIB8_9SPHI|nr:FecR domain-containing protein [Pedobacter ginsenosidimutans]KRT13343.1 hypothetical protein ASU31_25110 [Pedobacter ginsenosidimutans]
MSDRMKKNFFKRLARRYVKGNISDKQKSLLEAYFDYGQSRDYNAPAEEDREGRILDRVNLLISSRENPPRSFIPYYWAAAALLVICMAALLTFKLGKSSPQPVSLLAVITKKGEKKKVVLPDGSVVIVNSESELHYSGNFDGPERKVDLVGEAYFDVVHDVRKPFIVHSKKMDIRVLGTLFNVRSYLGETTEASLIRGAIQIFLPASNKALVTLKPNEKFVLGSGVMLTPSKQLVSRGRDFIVTAPRPELASTPPRDIEWIHNRLSFDDQGFREVAVLLERWYNVTITIDNPNLLKYRFTGTFNDTGLIDILDALKTSQDFNYRKEGERINIY